MTQRITISPDLSLPSEAAALDIGGGSFGTYMSRLRTLELIQGGRGATKASEEFFQ